MVHLVCGKSVNKRPVGLLFYGFFYLSYLVVGKSVTTKSWAEYSTYLEIIQDEMINSVSASYN